VTVKRLQSRKPKLGQNFLKDESYARRIVDALGDIADFIVIEIGPGRGVLTRLLAERCKKLIAVELDGTLASKLTDDLKDMNNIEILQADALEVNLRALVAGSHDNAKLIGNLPYYITSDLLLHFFAAHDVFTELIVMVQLEVAERICAEPGGKDFGMLSATAQFYCDCRLLFKLPPRAFAPPPKVHSAVVRMKVAAKAHLWGVEEKEFIAFLRKCFGHKRKTLHNNLRQHLETERVETALKGVGLEMNVRAEAVELERLAELHKQLRG